MNATAFYSYQKGKAKAYRKAHAKVEMHLFAQGNHAFNMGKRSTLKSINTWPQRMEDWLSDNGISVPAVSK